MVVWASCVAEDMLLVRAIGETGYKADWLKLFQLGSEKAIKNSPTYEDIKKSAKEIHQLAIHTLNSLNDEDLKKDNDAKIAAEKIETVNIEIINRNNFFLIDMFLKYFTYFRLI